MRLLCHLLRLAIALILAAASISKLLDLAGFMAILRDYHVFAGSLLKPIAAAIVVLELALAVWMLTATRLADAAWSGMVLFFIYGLFSAVALLRGFSLSNNGTFGSTYPYPLTWWTVGQHAIMVLLSLWLYRVTRRS